MAEKTGQLAKVFEEMKVTLKAQQDAALAELAPYYEKRDALVAQIQPFEEELRTLQQTIKQSEQPLRAAGNDLAIIARSEGAKTLVNERPVEAQAPGAPPGEETGTAPVPGPSPTAPPAPAPAAPKPGGGIRRSQVR